MADEYGKLHGTHEIEPVDHPQHYQTAGGLEVIDVIEAFELNFHLGNTTKYVLRAGKKGDSKAKAINDLEKARWYLDREIENRRKAFAGS